MTPKAKRARQQAFSLGVSPKKGEQPAEPPANTASPANPSNASTPSIPDNWIEELAGALFDSLIVWPSPWMEDIKDLPLYKELPQRRLIHLMLCNAGKAAWDEACDEEALLYLYPLTLDHPISEQWTRIYLYLGTKCLGPKFPNDIKQETLSDYDMGELRHLKQWIYKKKVEARKARARRQKAEAKMAHVAVKADQLKFF